MNTNFKSLLFICGTLLSQPALSLPVTTDLLAYWSADNTSANDFSGNGHHGSLINGANFGQGISGSAFQLNGTNQYIRVSDSPVLDGANLASGLTISSWIKLEQSLATDQTVVSKFDTSASSQVSYLMELDVPNPGLRTQIIDGSDQSSLQKFVPNSGFATDTWIHIAFSWDKNTDRLYINGDLVHSAATSISSIKDSSADLTIGALSANSSGNPAQFFHGLIDEVAIYSRALNETEISDLADEDQYVAVSTNGSFYYFSLFLAFLVKGSNRART